LTGKSKKQTPDPERLPPFSRDSVFLFFFARFMVANGIKRFHLIAFKILND
jgi:hypothetical protein